MKSKTAFRKGTFILTCLFFFTLSSFSQNNFKVSGKVTDETGKPVEGATVQVKGTAIATATTADGSYSLDGSFRHFKTGDHISWIYPTGCGH